MNRANLTAASIAVPHWLLLLAVVFAGCQKSGPAKLDKSTNLFIEAQDALTNGDTDRAMELLTASIEQKPSSWACFQRAKLYLDQGNEQEALADCQRGLEVEPDHQDLKWLAGEVKKPADKRFKGRFANPPSASK